MGDMVGCDDGERRYTINDIVRTFGISRTTIMYYEQLGIVSPGREGEQARRTYSDADVYRLMSAVVLKNVGIQPKDLPAYLETAPFSPGRCDEYAAMLERDIAVQQAKLERVQLYGLLSSQVGETGVGWVEPYYFRPDTAEDGYTRFPKDESLDLLIASMPLGGLGSRWEPGVGRLRGRNRWGRTVPVRYAGLVDGLRTEGLDVIGGCECTWCVWLSPDIRSNVYSPDDVDAGADFLGGVYLDLQDLMARRGLVADGLAFCPLSLPSDHGFVVLTCLPVRPAPSTDR